MDHNVGCISTLIAKDKSASLLMQSLYPSLKSFGSELGSI